MISLLAKSAISVILFRRTLTCQNGPGLQYPLCGGHKCPSHRIEHQMHAVVKWFVENVLTSQPLVAGIPSHFQMDWFNLSDERMLALRTACPGLSYICRTIHGARQFLQIMEVQGVKTIAKKQMISAAILAAHPLAADIVASYYTVTHPKPPENGLYDDLLHFMNVTRSRVTFLERKVINVIDLLERDDKYSRAVDPTDSWLIELDIGEKSLQEAKFKMKQALILQKQVEEAWLFYHKDHGALQ